MSSSKLLWFYDFSLGHLKKNSILNPQYATKSKKNSCSLCFHSYTYRSKHRLWPLTLWLKSNYLNYAYPRAPQWHCKHALPHLYNLFLTAYTRLCNPLCMPRRMDGWSVCRNTFSVFLGAFCIFAPALILGKPFSSLSFPIPPAGDLGSLVSGLVFSACHPVGLVIIGPSVVFFFMMSR